ncbi:unnamed protein product [Dicrocoelium dendriticum]|nr:unnamed protein product [Dicrocoelium dendriticum]
MLPRVYRPSRIRRATDLVFKGAVLTCVGITVAGTLFTVSALAKYYIFDKPVNSRQRREYLEAILRKEKREKELGLRD